MRPIPALTGIRGVAALWVLFFHVQRILLVSPQLEWMKHIRPINAGWTGVDLFFVLSGFILMHAHRDDFTILNGASISSFFKLRLARVYPISFVVLILIVALVAADPSFAGWYKRLADGNLSVLGLFETIFLATRWFLPDGGDWNQPVWSLSVEIIGYAAFPFLARLLSSRIAAASTAIGVAGVVLLPLVQSAMGSAGVNDIGQAGSLTRMAFCFIAGMALCNMRDFYHIDFSRYAGIVPAVAIFMILLVSLSPAGAAPMPIIFGLLIFSLSYQRGVINALLSSRIAMFLGKISFPLYLLHVMPLLWLGYRLRTHDISPIENLAAIAAYLIACLGVAAALHHFVERPAHRFGRRWALGGGLIPRGSRHDLPHRDASVVSASLGDPRSARMPG